MDTVILRKDGRLETGGKATEDKVLRTLGYRLELEPECSLRSVFEMLRCYPVLENLNDFTPALVKEYGQSPESGCVYEGVKTIEFSKTVEMIGFPEKRLEIYNQLKGANDDETFEIRSINLDNLLDIPLRLGVLKHVIFGDEVDVFEFDTVYILFEFIETIIWELSFHGMPKECQIRS